MTELKLRFAVQAAIRAFIVDNCPAHQQEVANAWASRVTGVGNICGFIFGYLDLPKILPSWERLNSKFSVLWPLYPSPSHYSPAVSTSKSEIPDWMDRLLRMVSVLSRSSVKFSGLLKTYRHRLRGSARYSSLRGLDGSHSCTTRLLMLVSFM